MTRPETVEALAGVGVAHQYRDVLGDYETPPHYKHFGCSCGWEQNVAGMSGWRSWVAAHETHRAQALLAAIDAGQVPGLVTSEAVVDAWDECATEAFERGLLHDAFAEEIVARNPYRHEDGGR